VHRFGIFVSHPSFVHLAYANNAYFHNNRCTLDILQGHGASGMLYTLARMSQSDGRFVSLRLDWT
jgi:hypothetical protein